MEFRKVQVRNSQTFEKSLLNKIARVSTKLEQEVETELKVSFALTFSQFRVLDCLLALGEVSQRELAAALYVTPAVVTRQVDALGSRGLVVAHANPRSKRENVVGLSKKGEQAAFDAAKAVLQVQARVLEGLPLKDETALERALDVLLKSWE